MSEDLFLSHRSLLFTVAYEMLGSATDAEDVVQEAWLKWDRVDHDQVRDPRAYLVRVVTRTALDRLRQVARRRETYVGPWLPEPLLTGPDVAEDAELADSLSTAMLLVLETLGPTERAVFVLREVFDFPHQEIAQAVGKSAAAVRQIARRARVRVTERQPRGNVSRRQTQQALEAMRRAIDTGDIQPLIALLAPDVVMLGDGGGIKQALPNPILGIANVTKLLRAGLHTWAAELVPELAEVNGWPALSLHEGGELDCVVTMRVEDGLVTGIYTVRNPDKLSGVNATTRRTWT